MSRNSTEDRVIVREDTKEGFEDSSTKRLYSLYLLLYVRGFSVTGNNELIYACIGNYAGINHFLQV